VANSAKVLDNHHYSADEHVINFRLLAAMQLYQ